VPADRHSYTAHIAVVGKTGGGLADAAHRHGCEITLVFEVGSVSEEQTTRFDCAVAVPDLTKIDDVAAAVTLLAEQHPVDYLLGVNEHAGIVAADVAEALGIPTPVTPEVARLLRDKYAMRRFLAADPTLTVRAHATDRLDDAREHAVEIGYPLIVKPNDGSGSLAVFKAHDGDSLADAFDAVSRVSPSVLIEEYLEGPEYSVEAFSHEGEHQILAITRKTKFENFVESGHVIPGLAGQQAEEVESVVRRFLDTLGVHAGCSHTEVILTPRGPRIVESHNRPGGDGIVTLLELATGINLADLTVGVPTGKRRFPAEPTRAAAAAVAFWTAPPGLIAATPEISAHDAERCFEIELPSTVGHEHGQLTHSSDRLGHVVVSGDDPDTVMEQAAAIVARHPYIINPVTADGESGGREREEK